jgi:hypothetical protein
MDLAVFAGDRGPLTTSLIADLALPAAILPPNLLLELPVVVLAAPIVLKEPFLLVDSGSYTIF